MRSGFSIDPKYSSIASYVRQQLGYGGAHGMEHVERVTALCGIIGSGEDADPDILIPAALLHDIARPLEKQSGIPHETEGARMAGSYLRSSGYDNDRIPAIEAAIRTHRFRSEEEPETLEARILSDADKLDAMGAFGIARTFMRAGEHGTGMNDAVSHFHEKLLHLQERLYTESARKIGRKRHAFLISFLRKLDEEENPVVKINADGLR